MKRAIIASAPLPAAALAELKQWLGINTAREDALLNGLLNAALEICESYTGVRPIEAVCEEIWPTRTPAGFGGWQALATRPVQRVSAVEVIEADGARSPLPAESYEVELDADGGGRLRIRDARQASRVAVRFAAGLAPDWATLPEALRQGVLRLAAHYYRARDGAEGKNAPPMVVTALWQPWRRVRLV